MSPLRKFWLTNYFVGVVKFVFLYIGRWIWGYSRWHCSPVNRRPYAFYIIETVEKMINDGTINGGYIVEVGCGRGDIIGNIQYDKCIGVDIDKNVIKAARFLHPRIKFIQGEMDAIPVDNIDVLIIVNWLHGVAPEIMFEQLCPVLIKTKVLIFDVFLDENEKPLSGYVDGNSQSYTHDGNLLGDGKFRLICKGPTTSTSTTGRIALRHVECWIKKTWGDLKS